MSEGNIEPPRPVIVAVEVEPTYVLGFPVYVALTIGASRKGASLTQLPLPSSASLRDAIGVNLYRPGEPRAFFERRPTAIVDPDLPGPIFRLRAGEVRRVLVEIEGLLPEDLTAGEVEAELIYGAPPRLAESARVRLRFREPTDVERRALTAIRPEVDEVGSYGLWARRPPASSDNYAPPDDPGDPLRYPRLLKYLIHGPEELSAIDTGLLFKALSGVFVPDAYGLAAELLAARDPGAAVAYAQQVKTSYPGLTAWMDALVAGQSEIAWARRHR